MDNDRVTKKLALFYHPLFQNATIEWILSFNVNQTLIDIMTFIEINLRIIKIILPDYTFASSIPSAVTDWVRGIDAVSPGVSASNHPKDKARQQNEIPKVVQEMIQEIPFDLASTPDKYISFFVKNSHQPLGNYIGDKISFSVFAKFLFDLCYSWCEHLDIELFIFFLIGVLYQATVFQSSNLLTTKPFEQVSYLSETFVLKVKQLKIQYKKKEYEYLSYEDWYNYNYQPSRLKEIKYKVIEVFSELFKEHESIQSHIEELFEGSISQIVKENLLKPTTIHFEYLSKENVDVQNPTKVDSTDAVLHTRFRISEKTKNQVQIKANTYSKAPKKTAMPIFGKSLLKPTLISRTHTVLSIDIFKDENDDNNTNPAGESPLCPIWEQEVSEAESDRSSYKENIGERSSNMISPNDSRGFSYGVTSQNIKGLESSSKSLLTSTKRFSLINSSPMESALNINNQVNGDRERAYLNKSELMKRSFQKEDDQLGDDQSMRIDDKINLILGCGEIEKENEQEKIANQENRRKVIANASLFDDLMSNIHGTVKNLANLKTSGEHKGNVSMDGPRASSQGAHGRRLKPHIRHGNDIEHSCKEEKDDRNKILCDTSVDKVKKGNLHLPQLGGKSITGTIKNSGYSQNLAQGYGVPAFSHKKQVVEHKFIKGGRSNSVVRDSQKSKNLKGEVKPSKKMTPQQLLEDWYDSIFDKMRLRHEGNRKFQDIRMRVLRKPDQNQKGRAVEARYNSKTGVAVEDHLVEELVKETAR